jgi:uncharacterized protein
MFGAGFGKLLFLVLIVVAVWYGWKYVERAAVIRHEQRRRASREAGASLTAEEMTKCRVCGSYVAKGAASCGRPDCPF